MGEQQTLPTMGFLGTGAITEAVVRGFCERAADRPFPIVVSPRTRETARLLQETYPNRVTVAESLQDVLDRSDWVVLALLPHVGEEVCRSLRFRREHTVINFMCDKTLPEIRAWIGETAALVHMAPLTFNAFCDGPILLTPPQGDVAACFGRIGAVMEVEQRYQAAALSAVTACVTPFYGVLDALLQWLRDRGVPAETATGYVTKFFSAVSQEALTLNADGVHTMATVSTPGGINLLAADLIARQGGFAAWQSAMTQVLARLAADIPPEE